MEAIGQLTGGVAHDFNNLLTVVIGNLELAEKSFDPTTGEAQPRQRRFLQNALRGAQRAATLTQRLLAFARRQPLKPEPLNGNELLSGMSDLLHRALGENVQVETVASAGLWLVEADRVQLESALLNLALNARDAMPDGGKLTIETANAYLDENYCRTQTDLTPGQYVVISVSDSGAGMTAPVLARAFEPFFTTKAAGQGTGLGLSQVYGFVKQSGGHVKIYSEPGHGTTVKVYLPRLRVDPSALDAPEAPVVGGKAETVLVVEDDSEVRTYVVEVLRDLDYSVLEAGDAEAALKMLGAQGANVALLLTDVVLPGMNGRLLADEAQRAHPHLKVLFMTGYSRNAIVHQGKLDAGVELLQKPITQAALASKVRAVLDGAPQAQQKRA
jgi:CheY-like chemotaxis protein